MKRNILITLLFCTVCIRLSAFARGDELDRLSEALGSGGISGFMRYVNEKEVSPPSIPSQWNVENRTRDDTERREKARVRALGFALAESAEKTITAQRELKADETLYRWVETLCDFADWCAKRRVGEIRFSRTIPSNRLPQSRPDWWQTQIFRSENASGSLLAYHPSGRDHADELRH